MIKINKKEILYFVGFFLMGLSNIVIGNSYLFGSNRFQICDIVQYMSAAFFLLYFSVGRYKVKDLKIVVFLGVVAFLTSLIMHDSTFALFGLSLVTAVRIDARKIVKISVINNAFFLGIVIIPAILGLIPDDIYYHGNMEAHCLGFAYYSNAPYIVLMGTVVIYWLIQSRKIARRFLLISFPVHLLVYKIFTVRLVMYLYVMFLMFILISKLVDTTKSHKYLEFLAGIMYPSVAGAVFFASFWYKNNPFLYSLNTVLNARLSFNLLGFERYGIKLLGQKIETSKGIDENFVNHYFYIDCGYVYMILGYGLILFIAIMILYMLISCYAMKTNDMKLLTWCFVVCAFSAVNNIMFNTALNPLPILGLKLLLTNGRKAFRIKNNMFFPE